MFSPEKETERIVKFIKEYMERFGFKKAVIGVSGGVDSAVVLGLLVRALNKDDILAYILPERDSNPESVKDAKMVCGYFGVRCKVKSITPILKKLGVYKLQPPGWFFPYRVKKNYALSRWRALHDEKTYEMDLMMKGNEEFLKGIAYYRAKHRVRMCYLYLQAEKVGGTVVGTTNKTEWLTGFYVKWGDDATDIEPLFHLYKTQVVQIGKYLGLPERILRKPPTPDLIPGVTDEFALGVSYKELDEILMKMEKGDDLSDKDPKVIGRVKEILNIAKMRNIRMVNLENWNFKE